MTIFKTNSYVQQVLISNPCLVFMTMYFLSISILTTKVFLSALELMVKALIVANFNDCPFHLSGHPSSKT